MEDLPLIKLNQSQLNGGKVADLSGGRWHLSLPPGKEGQYRLAQIDDSMHVPRKDFSFSPPFVMSLRARTSCNSILGTWGFGFWNDPFVMGLGLPGSSLRLPVLPNSAWFFHASEENYLSFQKNTPGNGMLSGVFSAPLIPSIFSLAALPFAPLLFLPPSAKIIRSLAATLIHEKFVQLDRDWSRWHNFEIEAGNQSIVFRLDGDMCMETRTTPTGRLGFVCWIDNQFLALRPDGKFRCGALATTQNTWLEISDLTIKRG